MAEQKFQVNCGFFDSVNNDRLYSADEMNRPYKRLVSNGVFATPQGTPSTDLQVLSANSGMNVIVKKGEGLIGDKWYENPSDLIVTVSINNDIVPRIDSIVAQVDKLQNGRVGNIVYREGTPNSSPQPPTINTNENIIEMRLANIYVAPTARYIGQDAISDLRGSSECLWVTSLIQQVDTSTLFLQWRQAYQNYYDTETEAFNAFMESLTEQLTVNTNIATYESQFTSSVDGTTEIPINITGYNKAKDVLMVRVNRLFASLGSDYTISDDSTKITLTKDIKANQVVDFLVLQSVVVGDTATVLQELQQMNTAISELSADTDWVRPTLTSDFKDYSANQYVEFRKIRDIVNIRGVCSPNRADNTLNSTNLTDIFTLPEGCRPKQQVITVCQGSGTNIFIARVSTDGKVALGRYRSGENYSQTPPDTNAWLTLNMTFFVI